MTIRTRVEGWYNFTPSNPQIDKINSSKWSGSPNYQYKPVYYTVCRVFLCWPWWGFYHSRRTFHWRNVVSDERTQLNALIATSVHRRAEKIWKYSRKKRNIWLATISRGEQNVSCLHILWGSKRLQWPLIEYCTFYEKCHSPQFDRQHFAAISFPDSVYLPQRDIEGRKLGCSSSQCSFNFRPKNMEEPVHRVRRRKMFSNTAGVLNWPSFSISIDFPTVYIDFLNILSKVGTYVTPIGFLVRWWYVACSTQKTKRDIFTFLVQSMPCLFHWPLQPRPWP